MPRCGAVTASVLDADRFAMRLVPNVPPDGGSTDWTDLLDDPRTVRAIFGEAPSLDQVELLSIELESWRRVATLHIELPKSAFPIFPPHKWREAGFTRAQVILRCWSVRKLEIRGLQHNPIVDLRIEREGELRRVRAATDEMSLDITADFLGVTNKDVSAYLHEDDWQE